MAFISGAEPSYTEIPLAPTYTRSWINACIYLYTYAFVFMSQANYIYHAARTNMNWKPYVLIGRVE